MRLPELTEKQKLELRRIKVAGTDVGYQVLLGLIAIDLMHEKAYGHPLSPEDYLLCLPNYKRHSLEEYFFPDDISLWVEKLSGYKGEATEQKRKEWASLTLALRDSFSYSDSFMTGKNYKEMVVFLRNKMIYFIPRKDSVSNILRNIPIAILWRVLSIWGITENQMRIRRLWM